jgi:hypothetical protein
MQAVDDNLRPLDECPTGTPARLFLHEGRLRPGEMVWVSCYDHVSHVKLLHLNDDGDATVLFGDKPQQVREVNLFRTESEAWQELGLNAVQMAESHIQTVIKSLKRVHDLGRPVTPEIKAA